MFIKRLSKYRISNVLVNIQIKSLKDSVQDRSRKMMSFQGKVVIVTGASSGIGAATAKAFAAEGAQVAMVGRNQIKLKNVAEQCKQNGSKPLVIVADVTKSEDNKRIVSETLSYFGHLDVLVNNADMIKKANILAPDAMEVFKQTIVTNLHSAVHLTHLAAPHLAQTKGNIVNVSSIAGLGTRIRDNFSYLTSKAALDHFTRASALDLAPKGIRVNAVNPGPVRTDIIQSGGIPVERQDEEWDAMGQRNPLKKVAEPEEIADLILFLASDKAKSITGSQFVSDNGALLVGLVKSPWE